MHVARSQLSRLPTLECPPSPCSSTFGYICIRSTLVRSYRHLCYTRVSSFGAFGWLCCCKIYCIIYSLKNIKTLSSLPVSYHSVWSYKLKSRIKSLCPFSWVSTLIEILSSAVHVHAASDQSTQRLATLRAKLFVWRWSFGSDTVWKYGRFRLSVFPWLLRPLQLSMC